MRIGTRVYASITGGAAVALGLLALGSALAREDVAVQAARSRLDGRWVATSVRSLSGELTGSEAGRFGLVFAGGEVVARGLGA